MPGGTTNEAFPSVAVLVAKVSARAPVRRSAWSGTGRTCMSRSTSAAVMSIVPGLGEDAGPGFRVDGTCARTGTVLMSTTTVRARAAKVHGVIENLLAK